MARILHQRSRGLHLDMGYKVALSFRQFLALAVEGWQVLLLHQSNDGSQLIDYPADQA